MRKKLKVSAITIALTLAATTALFFDNIKGYYRFKQYCAKEGGLRVYEPLEKNVGWSADDKYDARVPALLNGVDFVRYTDRKDGATYDLRYLGGNPQDDESFKVTPSNNSVPIIYVWKELHFDVKNEWRLHESGYKVANLDDNKISVRYLMFSYIYFYGPLDAKSIVHCFWDNTDKPHDLPISLMEITKSFKK